MPNTLRDAKKQKIVDLFTKQPPERPQLPPPAAPVAHRVRGNHNIIISGGSVSIHLSASACQAGKDGRHE